MQLLWLVTAIWAFSFSLIGEFLAATVDPYLAVSSRMLLALLLFSPFLFKYRTASTQALQLAGIGAVQLGLMYLLLYHSFLYLSVAEVLLFTILTPVYISVLDYYWRYKKLHWRWLGPAHPHGPLRRRLNNRPIIPPLPTPAQIWTRRGRMRHALAGLP